MIILKYVTKKNERKSVEFTISDVEKVIAELQKTDIKAPMKLTIQENDYPCMSLNEIQELCKRLG